MVSRVVTVPSRSKTAIVSSRSPGLALADCDGLDEDVETRRLIAAAVAAEQVIDLVDRGVTDIHFYTMNRADLVYAVCHLLGLRPRHKTVRAQAAE